MEKKEWDEDEVKFVQLCVDVSTWNMVAIRGLGRIQVKGEIVRIMTWICHEGSQLMSDLAVFFSGSVLSSSWNQVSFIRIDEVCLRLEEFYGLQITP